MADPSSQNPNLTRSLPSLHYLFREQRLLFILVGILRLSVMGLLDSAALAQQLRGYKSPPSSSFDESKEMQTGQETAGKVVSQVALVSKDLERFRPKRAADQLRRDVAQLLESGQTQKAKIRVEHMVGEEKTVAAYELVGIYCELLVARLGVIESQKTCPDRKDFVSAAIGLQPDSSLVDKLSVKAPNGPMKIKILTEITTQHNVMESRIFE